MATVVTWVILIVLFVFFLGLYVNVRNRRVKSSR